VAAGMQAATWEEWSFALARYFKNGKLDSSFGVSGFVTTIFHPGGYGHDQGGSVAIQADGKIVMAGSSDYPGFNVDLARYQKNGKPDQYTQAGGCGYRGSILR
jgi:hypothetical protein